MTDQYLFMTWLAGLVVLLVPAGLSLGVGAAVEEMGLDDGGFAAGAGAFWALVVLPLVAGGMVRLIGRFAPWRAE